MNVPIGSPYPPLARPAMLGVGARPRRPLPLVAAVSPAAATFAAFRGLGQDAPPDGTAAPATTGPLAGALAIGLLAAAGWLSFQAGKAMAPRASKPATWGWIGVPVGLLVGPIGLGVMGLISNQKDQV